jgi:hypothetical protein
MNNQEIERVINIADGSDVPRNLSDTNCINSNIRMIIDNLSDDAHTLGVLPENEFVKRIARYNNNKIMVVTDNIDTSEYTRYLNIDYDYYQNGKRLDGLFLTLTLHALINAAAECDRVKSVLKNSMDADEVCTDVLERIKVCALEYDVVIKNGNNLSSFVQISKKLANPLLTNYYDYIEISQDGKMLGTISFIKDDLDGYTICVIGTNGVNYSSKFEFGNPELEHAVELITT